MSWLENPPGTTPKPEAVPKSSPIEIEMHTDSQSGLIALEDDRSPLKANDVAAFTNNDVSPDGLPNKWRVTTGCHPGSRESLYSFCPRVDRITFLTFNAGLLDYRICGCTLYQNPPFTRRRLSHMPVALRASEADIVALQEVYDESQADFLTESLRLAYPFVGRRTSGGFLALHNGLMVLSKFPILHTRFHSFSQVTAIERVFGSKGFLEVSVGIPGIGAVTLFNIHLASGAVDPESEALEALRNEEIHQVLEASEAAVSRGEMPMIIGDLNAAPELSPSNYRHFVDRGWRDTFLMVTNTRGGAFVDNANGNCEVEMTTPRGKGEGSSRAKSVSATDCGVSGGASVDASSSVAVPIESEVSTRDATLISDELSTIETYQSRATLGAPSAIRWKSGARKAKQSMGSHPSKRRLTSDAFSSEGDNGDNMESLMTTRTDKDVLSNGTESPEESSCLIPELTNEATSNSFTWDPNNPLNTIGPHAGCHGLRCDHIFLPAVSCANGLSSLLPIKADIIFREPRVMVDGCCLGCFGSAVLVTLSDHYGLRIELQRQGSISPERQSAHIIPQLSRT